MTKPRRPTKKVTRVVKEPPKETAQITTPWFYEAKPQTIEVAGVRDQVSGTQPETRDLVPNTSSRPSLRCLLTAVAIFLFPFITIPWTFSFHEFPKQLFLSLLVAVGLLVILRDFYSKKTLEMIPRHPFIVLGIATILVGSISASRSGLLFSSIFGSGGTEPLSLLGMLLLGLWVLLAYHAGRENARLPLLGLFASGSVLSLLTVLSLAGVNLYRFIPAQGFNPAGTTTIAGIIAAATLILGLGLIQASTSRRNTIVLGAAMLPALALLIGGGLRIPWLTLTVGLAVLTLTTAVQGAKTSARTSGLLLLLTIVAILLTLYPSSLSFLPTPLEVSPAHQETWSIARQVLAEHPLLGSGPASFSAQYLRFRSLPIVQTPFWNVSFDWGSSAGLTFLTTLGWVGGGLLVLTVLSVLVSYLFYLQRDRTDGTSIILLSAGIALFVAGWLAPAPLAVRFMLDTLLGLMLAKSMVRPLTLRLGGIRQPLVGSLIILIVAGILLLQGRRASAEFLATQGVRELGSNLASATAALARATRLDPWSDAYRRLLSDANRLALRAKLQEAPPPTDPQAALTAVRDLADQTLKSARRATELAPSNVANWNTLGQAYLEIAPITNGAAQAAVNAFQKAQGLSPADPAILVNLAVANSLAAQSAQGETGQALAKAAEETLRRATELRPTFPFAHLELARLLARDNKVEEATAAYRQAQALAPQDAALRFEIGLFLMQKNKKDEARTELEQAIQLAPQFSNARWFLAQLLEESGDTTGAIAQIEKVLELNPDNAQAKTRLEELKKKTQ